MSNTTIQIKRSSVTTQPGSLSAAEPAYSYLSDKLFIGDASGSGVIAIGGKYFVDQLNVAFAVANAAFGVANSSTVANQAYVVANAAFDKANSANVLAYNTGIGANAYADFVGTSANSYAAATYLPFTGGTVTGDLNITANLTVTGTTTYVNTATLLVSDNIFVLNADVPVDTAPTQDAGMEVNRGSSANVSVLWNETSEKWTFTNNGSTYLNIASNTDIEGVAAGANAHSDAVGVSANAYADVVGTSANSHADAVGVNANTFATSIGTSSNAYASAVGVSANVYAAAVGVSANAYAAGVGTNANTYASAVGVSANAYADVVAANGSFISTGVVKVPYGGTGATTFTTNGVLYGDGTNALKVTSSGSEGNVLQVSASGVPQFGMLDGGTF